MTYWPIWFIIIVRWICRKNEQMPVNDFIYECYKIIDLISKCPTTGLEGWLLRIINKKLDTDFRAACLCREMGVISSGLISSIPNFVVAETGNKNDFI